MPNAVRQCPVGQKLEKSQKRADNFEMSFSIKVVENSVRKCAFVRNWL